MRTARAKSIIVVTLMLAWSVVPGRAACGQAATEELRLQLLGVLTYARVDVDFDDVPLRDALDRLGRALGVTILGRYEDDPAGHGLDSGRPITLHLRDVPARDALEMIVDQAALFSSCTWQMRTGYVEVGTKRRLARATRREMYPLDDFLLEPPYLAAPSIDGRPASPHEIDLKHFNEHDYRPASLKPADLELRPSSQGALAIRFASEELFEELVRAIAEVVEPGNWDFELSRNPPTGDAGGRGPGPYRSSENRIARVRPTGDGRLVIVAPGFFHRQIVGPGMPTPPSRSYVAERASEQPGVVCRRMDLPAPRPSIFSAAPPKPAMRREKDEADGAGPPVIRGTMTGEDFYDRAFTALYERRIDVDFDGVTLREAIDVVAAKLGLPVIGRFKDDALGYGLEPKVPVTLQLTDVPAIAVIESMIDEAAAFAGEECTWQIRRGYIELGTKERLSVPAARTLRLYYVRDLMIEPSSPVKKRKVPGGVALDQVETIVTTIEPDAWDWGQIEYYDDDVDRSVRRSEQRSTRRPAGNRGTGAHERPEYVEAKKPAIIRHWRDVLIVHAPDYIHRQLDGQGASRIGGNRAR